MKFFQHEKALVSPRAKIGANTRIWAFANIQDGVTIGENCNICDGCFVEKGVVIGSNVTMKNGVALFEGMTVEDHVFLGQNSTFVNDRHPRSQKSDWKLEKTLIKEGATIGANATVLCGITIGEFAVVGAGSVVTKNVANYQIVVGNPARERGWACRCGKILPNDHRCSCGSNYQLKNEGLFLNG